MVFRFLSFPPAASAAGTQVVLDEFEAGTEAAVGGFVHPKGPFRDGIRQAGFAPELEANLHCLMMSPGAGALVTCGGIT
jgi:hypothetical protein